MNLAKPDAVNADAPLRVRLLGPPAASWLDRPLSPSRRQVRALLYRLGVDLQPIPRERLFFLFWPDIPESAARRKLTNLLSHLRRTLPAPGVLMTGRDCVWLDPELAWSDTAAFDRLCAQAGTRGQAVELYHGPFMEGFCLPGSPEFDQWATLERLAWERRHLDALAALIEEYAARQAYDAAITCARRYLATDELAEDVHRRLIELYAAAGDRALALQQYEHCAAVLERELGVRPLPQTQAVYQSVLAARTLPRAMLVSAPRWTTLPSLHVPLIGRRAALGRLDRAYSEARAGRGGTVLLEGEPGIGKSRLMQEFASRVQGEALVLAGAGYPDMQTTPYQPLVEALRPALLAGHAWLQVPRRCLADAAHLLPELRPADSGPAPPPADSDPHARSRLFEALRDLALALARGPHPLVLCLDDLQWADRSTLDWLAYLGRRLDTARLLVVGAYRSADEEPIAELRHSLTRQGCFAEITLEGLDEDAVLEVISSLREGASVPGAGASAARLTQVTGGNPFFLMETLRAVLESGQPMEVLSDPENIPTTDTIREVVERRVKRLSPTARQVLEAGAVLGQSFTFELVQRTSGRREMETVDGLDELFGRHLLMAQGADYRFSHQLVQVIVYQGLSYGRRRLLHRRAAETLEELQPENAAALARHLAQAEEAGRAAVYALRAGRAAKSVFAHIEARRHFDQALALLAQEAAQLQEPGALAANQALRIEALHERGWALRLLGDMEAYADDLREVASLAESLQDVRTLAHLRWREAYTHRWFCRYPQARAAAEAGLDLSRQVGDRLLEAQCWREIGMAARETGDYETAQRALAQALAGFTDLGETVYRIHTLGNLATLQFFLGDFAASMRLAQQALAICDEEGLPLHRRLPLGDLGAAAVALGDADLARRCLEESLAIARETADRTQQILCLLHLGWLCIGEGRPAAALQYLQAGLDLAEAIGSCTEQGWLRCGLAEVYRQTGEHAMAAEFAGRALEEAIKTGRPYDQALARRILERLGAGDSAGES
jgi:DNA-binding SARP family transcriptional activator